LSWSREFDDPISLPDSRKQFTLKNAADYIAKFPKTESDLNANCQNYGRGHELWLAASGTSSPLAHRHHRRHWH
jgi:hypothetical protein